MAPWTPTLLGSPLRAFWEGDSLAGADASAVSSWTDQTSNAYALAQGTPANQPILKTNIVNGHQVVRFATNDFLTIASGLGATSQPITIFGVWNMANSSSQTLIQDNSTTSIGLFITAGGLLGHYAGGAAFTAAITKGAWRMTMGTFNGASSFLAIDGGTHTTGNSGTSAFNTGAIVGATTGGGSFYLNGDIAALLVLTGTLTTANEDNLFGWAAWKYGLSANLPSTHPYKNRPPGTSAGLRYALGTGLRNRTLWG